MWPFRKKPSEPLSRSPGDNRWTGGQVNLVLPPLEAADVGASGARFLEVQFQPDVGPEMFLCILEESEWARRYKLVRELDLYATTLAVQTEIGPVAMVIWRLARGQKTLVQYEHYLDPLNEPTRRLLRRIEAQPRLKLVMRDNRTGETTGFWEFDNNFTLGEFADRLAQAVVGMVAGPFSQRVAEVQRTYRVEDLIAAAKGI